MVQELLVLDGPTGTELVRRGFTAHPLLWTGLAAHSHPDLLRQIHEDYVRSGAHVLTANTFRTHAFSARQAGLDQAAARELTLRSVEIARRAASIRPGTRVAGSLAPLADCYAPADTPPESVLAEVHGQTAGWLVEAGCDLVLIETMGTGCEAIAALQAARRAGARTVWLSFLPASDGAHLLSGEPLAGACGAGAAAGADAILLNCAHADVIERALPLLPANAMRGAYANAARMIVEDGRPLWEADPRPPLEKAREYARRAAAWARGSGLSILGGCCGMTPLHIRLLAEDLGCSSPHPITRTDVPGLQTVRRARSSVE